MHDPAHVAWMRRLAEAGGGQLDPDTIASEDSFDAAVTRAGARWRRLTRCSPERRPRRSAQDVPPAITPSGRERWGSACSTRCCRGACGGVRGAAGCGARLGRASRQRHRGHLLGRPRGAVRVVAPIRLGLLPGNGGGGRSRVGRSAGAPRVNTPTRSGHGRRRVPRSVPRGRARRQFGAPARTRDRLGGLRRSCRRPPGRSATVRRDLRGHGRAAR